MATSSKQIKEPSVIIRPVGRMGGLDSIHVALIALVLVLIALLLAVSYVKPVPIPINATATNCTYGVQDGKCVMPIHNISQIKRAAESFLASYNYVNTSLSLLPYISNVSAMNVSYGRNGEWYVTVPAKNPSNNVTFYFAMSINDKNVTDIIPLIQTVRPGIISNNTVVSQGVVRVAGKSNCTIQKPLQIYWFIDPYSPGSISSLSTMQSLQSKYQSNISIGVKILLTQYSENIANTYGLNNTLNLGKYLYCAANQTSSNVFFNRIQNAYNGSYMPLSLLQSIENQADLNTSSFNNCLNSFSSTLVNRQALLAQFYNITSSPSIITNCQYLSIPQTENLAINYANKSIS